MKKELIIISGPTGVGKTDFVDQMLNKKNNAEVINIDMGQFYEPISIGTAKPDYKATKYKQHLFDIIKEPVDFDVAQYRKLVIDKINELWGKNILPLLVGGSAFYIQSLLFPPGETDFPEIDFLDVSNEKLWQKLNSVDPERAKQININDRYRLERALTIWEATNQKPSEFVPQIDLFADKIEIFILTREREKLYKRIDERVIEMINSGWIDEVKNLSSSWRNFLKKKKLIGYDDIINYLENNLDKNELISTIQKKTRNYAKRQMTFYRKMEKDISKFNSVQKEQNSIILNWIQITK
ncbi:tRNA (adenosine(37)-N6)-dimethylallyltransferase MiaA [candidate division TM6 bacterium RIFCSPHIGHO2_12_FULL_32_22]|nr:MAG: tRNA (adenosine(37)-N6)-dimethylallyltransferase MiaA [candidate division TM6 bacterium RIFCSPHIGHO2_12_FULL_32_22]